MHELHARKHSYVEVAAETQIRHLQIDNRLIRFNVSNVGFDACHDLTDERVSD